MTDARIGTIKAAIIGAVGYRLEGKFWAELKHWEKQSGLDLMGTDAIEADVLTRIAQQVIRDLTDAEIAERVAEMLR